MKLKTYTVKIEGENWNKCDEIEETCWYNAQKVFTEKIKKSIGEYIRFDEQIEAEKYGLKWDGPGMYSAHNGDSLIDGVIYNTFFDGKKRLTITVPK